MCGRPTPDTGVRISAESGELKSRFEPGPEISMLEPTQSNSFNAKKSFTKLQIY